MIQKWSRESGPRLPDSTHSARFVVVYCLCLFCCCCCLQSVEGERAIEMALQDPERFVLKPQREGGGEGVRV